MDTIIGRVLSHYQPLEKIGAGAMGEVYRAQDTRLEREVALKILPPAVVGDEDARKRFRAEALTLSKLNHPNIAIIFDFDRDDEIDFLVMEYISGTTVTERLRSGPLPEQEVIRLGLQLADGLAAAHQQGIIHRDLKPANLRLTADGRLKILDFGLATLVKLPTPDAATMFTMPESGSGAGTLPYMAPEQLIGPVVDLRADIFAAGNLLYEMTTGRRAFPEQQFPRLVEAILHSSPVRPRILRPQLSADLEALILKALEKRPEDRYQTVVELRAQLERLAQGSSKGQRPKSARRLRATPRRIRSIAVLPMRNLGGDPEQEYFADGMTEALITDMAKIRSLRVISRASAMRYKGTKTSLPEIAAELNVDAILEGSVQLAGGQVRINAQLVDPTSDHHVWAETYTGPLSDMLQLQSEVAQSIAREIKAAVTPEETKRLAARQIHPESQVAYLKGRHQAQKWTSDGLKSGIALFRQSIELDPTYARAYVGLADAFAVLGLYDLVPPLQAYPKAKAAAAKALVLDPQLAEAHATMAHVKLLFDWDVPAAEQECLRTLRLNPSYAPAYEIFSAVRAVQGRHEEALQQAKQAEKVDPLSPVAVFNVGWVLYIARQYEESRLCIRRSLELDPAWPVAHLRLGLAHEGLGQFPEAIAAYQKAVTLSGGSPLAAASLAHALAAAGQKDEARAILEKLKAASTERYVSAFALAVAYLGLGEQEAAMEHLEKAREERSTRMVYLPIDPRFDPLRGQPRFEELVRSVQLERPSVSSGTG